MQNDKNLNEKEFRDCERSANGLNDTKVDIRRDYTQTFDATDGSIITRLPDGSAYNSNGSVVVPLAGAVPASYR